MKRYHYLILIIVSIIGAIIGVGCVQQSEDIEGYLNNTNQSISIPENQTSITELPANNFSQKEKNMLNVSLKFTIKNERTGKSFNMHEIVNESGIYIYFDDPLPKFSRSVPKEEYESYVYSSNRTEANRLIIPILNKSYALSCLDYNTKSGVSRVCLAEEKAYAVLDVVGCNKIIISSENITDYIETSDGKYAFAGYGYKLDNYDYVAMCKLISEGACGYEYKQRVGTNSYLPYGDILHIWNIETYPNRPLLCASRIEVSLFTREIILESASDVVVEWNATTKNQMLKSIVIPSTSPIYKELINQNSKH